MTTQDAQHQDTQRRCLRCGNPFEDGKRPGRPRLYCSDKCAQGMWETGQVKARVSEQELKRVMAGLMMEILVEAQIITPGGNSAKKLRAIGEALQTHRNR